MSKFTHHIFVCINERPKVTHEVVVRHWAQSGCMPFLKKKWNVSDSKESFEQNKAGCLDQCEYGPSVVIYPEGIWYWVGKEADVTEIMERHIGKGEIVERLLMPGKTVRFPWFKPNALPRNARNLYQNHDDSSSFILYQTLRERFLYG